MRTRHSDSGSAVNPRSHVCLVEVQGLFVSRLELVGGPFGETIFRTSPPFVNWLSKAAICLRALPRISSGQQCALVHSFAMSYLRDVVCPAASALTHNAPARSQFEQAGICWSHLCLRCLHRVQAVTLLRLTLVRGWPAIVSGLC